MTPKEKAKELFNKMVATYDITSDFCYDSTAKQCALIAVDEIISIKLLWYQKDTKELNYWQEVKNEIEKL